MCHLHASYSSCPSWLLFVFGVGTPLSAVKCSVRLWRFVTDFDVGENGRGGAGSLGTSHRGTSNCRCARAKLKVGLWQIV